MTTTLTLIDYNTGDDIRELTAAESATYMEMLEAMMPAERHVGAMDGEVFGQPGCTIYAQ